jgi:hypothetical protein
MKLRGSARRGRFYSNAGTLLLAALSLAGCGQDAPVTPESTTSEPAVILTADATSVASGGTSTLSWSSTNATSCTASGGWSGTEATSGSTTTGALTATTSYTLTCSGAGGTTPAASTATVTVTPPTPAPTVTLTANPTNVASGGTSTLTWSSANATSCTASGGWSGSEATSGSTATGALTATTTYTLTCSGAGGTTPAAAAATVTVTPPAPTVRLTANPTSVASGGTSTLTWSSTNATSCTASGGWSGAKAASGSTTTSALTASMTYTLTCSGAGGTTPAAASTTVTVTSTPPAPTVNLTANPTSVASGGTSTLTWSSTNATSCTASAGWSGTKATSGSTTTGALTATTSYTLTCSGAGGTTPAAATATVTVIPPEPTVTLTANPTSVASGGTSTLTWSSTHATSCTASGGWSGTKATIGSAATAALTVATTYTLTCSGASGTTPAAAAATVTVNSPNPTVTLTGNPTSVASGGTSTLTWSTTNATSCTASGGWSGTKATSGSATTSALTVTTTYTLTCSGAGGTTPAAASATVTVVPAPTVTLSANPTSVVSGGSSTLTWSSTNATSCTASGGWSGTKATSGNVSTGALTATTSYTLTCSGIGGSHAASTSVSVNTSNSFPVTPPIATLTLSQSQQFTATVPGGGAATWSVDGVAGGNATVGTISTSGFYVPPSTAGTHAVLATSVANPALSGSATAAVTDLSGIYTFHNDLARTGQNLQEYALTPTTVSSGNFGKRWTCTVDGNIFAQPLYAANLAIGGGVHNVLFVATEHDSVYAFDADDPGCSTYWQISTLGTGITTIPIADADNCNGIPTEFGITGSPVIDSAAQTLFFVAATKENGSWYQRLHAVALATGAEKSGSPAVIEASVPTNAGGTVTFSALWEDQRPALALYSGGVFIGWASHCDAGSYWGWLMRYDSTSLSQTAVFNVAPNGSKGGIWMSAGAPAVDSSGRMFLTTGNGVFDDSNSTVPPVAPDNDFSMSFLNLNSSTLAVQDFYTPSMEAAWSSTDWDISSAGVTVLPDGSGPTGHPNLLVGSDKQGHLWLIDRTDMSRFSATSDNTVQYLQLPHTTDSYCGPANCIFATPTYYNGTVYFAPASAPLLALSLTNGLFSANAQGIATASAVGAEGYGFPGPTPMISASPTGNALVWALDNSLYQNAGATHSNPAGPAILRAYNATSLGTALYSSSKLAADTGGDAVKFTVPVVANGHVYVGGAGQLTVYGFVQ